MRRAPLVLGILAAVLVTGAWWLWLISPRNDKISDIEQQQTTAVDTEARLRGQVARLQEIQDREIEYLAALARLDDLIPEVPILEEFIDEVHQLALDTGVDLGALSPALPAALQESELREVLVSIQLEGEFFDVIGFLFGLNDMERLVRVDAISVSSMQAPEGTLLSVTLEARLFTLADAIPLQAVEEDPADGTETTATTAPIDVVTTTSADSEAAP